MNLCIWGEGPPVRAGRFEWQGHELTSRSIIMTSVEAAYEGIGLPWFPSRAWVEALVNGQASTVEA